MGKSEFFQNKINCETYEVYCSQIIENSPSLKLHPEVYQQSCEVGVLRIQYSTFSNVVKPIATILNTFFRQN